MKKIIKIVILAVIVIAIAGGVYYSMTAPVTVPTTTVAAKTVELAISERGVVSKEKQVLIYPLAQGPLLRVYVTEGQTVGVGDILCEIDPGALHMRVEELRGAIRGYEAQIRLARAQAQSTNAVTDERINLQNAVIAQRELELGRAQEHLRIMEEMFELGIIPKIEVDAARDIVIDCHTAVIMSQQELLLINAGREVANLAQFYQTLIESTEVTIAIIESEEKNYTVISTAAGVITRLPVNDSNVVNMAIPVAEITVPDDAVIEVFVSTQDINSIRVGDTVDLVLNRREGEIRFNGRISHIDSVAEIRLSALGIEERRVKVEIIPNMAGVEDAELGNGFDVGVRFILFREENKLAVPRTALFKDGDADMIWVVRDGAAQTIEVTLGMELRTETVVESGLADGDVIVTDANNTDLKIGVAVRE